MCCSPGAPDPTTTSNLLYDEFALAHELRDWQRTEVIARHGLAVLVVLRELCIRIEAFLGWDFASWTDAINEMIKRCYVAAGMADGEIRERLGLEPLQRQCAAATLDVLV